MTQTIMIVCSFTITYLNKQQKLIFGGGFQYSPPKHKDIMTKREKLAKVNEKFVDFYSMMESLYSGSKKSDKLIFGSIMNRVDIVKELLVKNGLCEFNSDTETD